MDTLEPTKDVFVRIFFTIVCSALGYRILKGIIRLSGMRKKALRLDKLAVCENSKRHWLLGHFREYNLFNHEGLVGVIERVKKYPKLFCFWPVSFHAVMHLYHPTTVAPLLKKGYNEAPKHPRLYDLIRPWLGQGLLTSEGAIWAKHRRLITPAFHFKILKQYNKVFNDCSRVLVKKLAETGVKNDNGKIQDVNKKPVIEVSKPLALMTFDSLMRCAFSTDTDCQNTNHPYVDAVREVTNLSIQRIDSPWRLFLVQQWIFDMTGNGKRFKQVLDKINSFADDLISKRRNEREAHPDESQLDFLDTLLRANDGSERLSDKEIRDEVNTFMFAGHDTTSNSMSWAMYNLAKHPEIQEKCREEINRIVGDTDEDITWDMLPKLKYLTMVIKENLRLYPPVIAAAREIKTDMEIPSPEDGRTITIPKGTTSLAFVYMMHRNPILWKDPEIFDPERFSMENREKIPAYAFIPFSAGPRNCIGQTFAMNEMKVTMAHILRSFRLSLSDQVSTPKMKPIIILQSENGIYVHIEKLELS